MQGLPQGPRARVLASTRRALTADNDEATNQSGVQVGQMKLRAFVAPPLAAGNYVVDVEQLIGVSDSPNEILPIASRQEFTVIGPRYSLPADAIHQIYPPQGHEDDPRVLPHITLKDWMLPWEQKPNDTAATKVLDDQIARVPWLALLTFTEQEIGLSDQEMAGLCLGDATRQNRATMAVTTTIGAALSPSSPSWVSSVRDDHPGDPLDKSEKVDLIFVQNELFTRIFGVYDESLRGPKVPFPRPLGPSDLIPDLTKFAFMAHVREINVSKMANSVGEETAKFAVIVSPRNGPLLQKKDPPVTIYVHLVSLLGVESVNWVKSGNPGSDRRIALPSLHSWSYTCVSQYDARDTLRELGRQLDPSKSRLPNTDLSVDVTLLQGEQGWLRSSAYWKLPDAKALKIAERMFLGFDLARYKAITGENTLDWIKGPLEPAMTLYPKANLPTIANNSMSLAQLDTVTGILDITYATAWELGRTLAVADRTFAASLVRLRKTVHVRATKDTVTSVSPKAKGKIEVMHALAGMVEGLKDLPHELPPPEKRQGTTDMGAPHISALFAESPSMSTMSPPPHMLPEFRPIFQAHVRAAIKELASSEPLSSHNESSEPPRPFNEHNRPRSSDWAIVLKWIVDRLYLYNIPFHYLVGDPSKLPPESIRFFYIDANWTDALIDGALSLGNHFDRQEDTIRLAIKEHINEYLQTPLDAAKHPHPPQIPTFGFLMRSELVEKMPDLEVHAPWPQPSDTRNETLRLETIAADVLLCLFDRLPGSPEFSAITLQQPPHQQRFVAAKKLYPRGSAPHELVHDNPLLNLESSDIEVRLMPLEGDSVSSARAWNPIAHSRWLNWPALFVADHIYDFDLHALNPRAYAKVCNDLIRTSEPNVALAAENAALLAFQLNDPIMKLTIKMPPATAPEHPEDPTWWDQRLPRPDATANTDGSLKPIYRQLAIPSSFSTIQSPENVISSTLAKVTEGTSSLQPHVTPTYSMESTMKPQPTTWPRPYVPGRSRPNLRQDGDFDPQVGRQSISEVVLKLPEFTMDRNGFSTELLNEDEMYMDYQVFILGSAGSRTAGQNTIPVPSFPSLDGASRPSLQLPVDLVFCIKRKPYEQHITPVAPRRSPVSTLKSITVELAQEGPDASSLMYRYEGLGVEMIGSNTLWTPVLGTCTYQGRKCLQIKLISRAFRDGTPMLFNSDISFVLHGVHLNASGQSGTTKKILAFVAEETGSAIVGRPLLLQLLTQTRE